MNTTAAGAQRQIALDDFNVVCCFCVVLAHTLSLGIIQADPYTWQMAAIYFPWLAARFSVPGFLFVGGVKVGLSVSENTAPSFSVYIKRRIQKVWIPYLIWTTVYYVCFIPIGYVEGSFSEFFGYLYSGTLSAQFYYVFVVMQFYLLRPLWFRLLTAAPAQLVLPVSYLLMLASGTPLDWLTARLPVLSPILDHLFLRFLFYWTAGLYAGRSFEKWMDVLSKRWITPVCLATLAVYYILSYLEFLVGTGWVLLSIIKPLSNLAAILFLLRLCRKNGKKHAFVMDFLYQSSTTVFFSHCLFLTLGTAALNRFGITRLVLLLPARLLLACVLPLLLYWDSQHLFPK